jgi:hypothetical protein
LSPPPLLQRRRPHLCPVLHSSDVLDCLQSARKTPQRGASLRVKSVQHVELLTRSDVTSFLSPSFWRVDSCFNFASNSCPASRGDGFRGDFAASLLPCRRPVSVLMRLSRPASCQRGVATACIQRRDVELLTQASVALVKRLRKAYCITARSIFCTLTLDAS